MYDYKVLLDFSYNFYFSINILNSLLFLLNLCFVRISILALRYHRNSSASPPVLGLWLPWPPLTVAIAAREIKDKQFVVYRHILTVCPIFIN